MPTDDGDVSHRAAVRGDGRFLNDSRSIEGEAQLWGRRFIWIREQEDSNN